MPTDFVSCAITNRYVRSWKLSLQSLRFDVQFQAMLFHDATTPTWIILVSVLDHGASIDGSDSPRHRWVTPYLINFQLRILVSKIRIIRVWNSHLMCIATSGSTQLGCWVKGVHNARLKNIFEAHCDTYLENIIFQAIGIFKGGTELREGNRVRSETSD